MNMLRRLLILLAVSTMLSGCVVTMGKHNALKERVVALEAENSKLLAQAERHEQRIANIKTYVDDQLELVRNTMANLRADLDSARQELAQVGGTQEEVVYRLDQVQGNIKGLKGFLHEKLGEEQEGVPEDLPKDPEGMFKAAKDLLDANKFKPARAIFLEFIKENPDHTLTDDAQFNVAETLFGEKNYKDAVTQYRLVYDQYQRGDRFREAVLKIGLSYELLGDCKRAVKIYKFASDEFKKSPAGNEAKEKYKSLKATCK